MTSLRHRHDDAPRCRAWEIVLIVLALTALVPARSEAQQIIRAQKPVQPLSLPVEQLSDAELSQQLISNFLVSAEEEQFKEQRKDMDVIIGDMRRVAGLPPERLRLLEIAAKGAVDRSLEGWRSAEENQTRQQVGGLAPDVVQQRLEGMGGIRVGNEGPERNGLWRSVIENVLTAEERVKWTQAEDERRAYRTRAMAQMLVAELDRQTSLSLTQCEKLEPLVLKALEEYLPDMANYTDRNSGVDFRMLLLMLTGAPTEEVQAVLTPDQYGKWQQITADYRGWWQSIEQNHRTRMSNEGRQNQLQNSNGIIINGGGRVILQGGGVLQIK